MHSSQNETKSIKTHEFSNQLSKSKQGRQSIDLKKSFHQQKNPEQQDQQIKQVVKQYLRGKNIEELKNKFLNERLIKRRNRGSIEIRRSRDFKKENANQAGIVNTDTLENFESNHSSILDHYHEQSEKYKSCNCGAHHLQTNQIKFKPRDPVSKFQSNYTMDTKQAKTNSKIHSQKPQITAGYYSSRLENLPQYSPKLDTVRLDSSYKSDFANQVPKQRVDSFKYLKMSNVNFGPKQIKNFESAYQQQCKYDADAKYSSQTPQPFVVKEPQNLNTFGLKYTSIASNYKRQFQTKQQAKRPNLKPPSLFKDLDLYLIKQSNYKQSFSSRKNDTKTSKKNRQQKIPVVHHLSSSFIPLNGVNLDEGILDSLYKKEFKREKEDVRKFSCPHGVKSSHGIVSKL